MNLKNLAMKCINDEIIQKYIDGEMKPQESALIEKHKETCRECADKVTHQLALKAKVVDAVNLLAGPLDNLPIMRPVTKPSKGKRVLLRRVIPLLAAASIMLFVVFLTQKDKTLKEKMVVSESFFVGEIDANRTVAQQELTITVISPEGMISEHIVE